MNNLKLFLLIIATVFLTIEAISLLKKPTTYDWKPMDLHKHKVERLAKYSLNGYNAKHNTNYKLRHVIEANKKKNGEKKYKLKMVGYKNCKDNRVCFNKFECKITEGANKSKLSEECVLVD
ncbi:Proteinase inhibitor I25, cystatin domain-containing protein [Strongyloides ratti]|uniref:Proteinase inhibitor I25, cystatin domain-containing protein n=1 Tax=Strongyloides ratti TaxID=34506 RepID=A0A090L7M0_STRRB|nr:Proteinase inhibitor I25, cystatin domain-containing protein [Strongyloides ratti]CEF65786.1 Proteinase inhibitor I25, cystatin domain-containing protein [Strongyloides ratti]